MISSKLVIPLEDGINDVEFQQKKIRYFLEIYPWLARVFIAAA
jgi:hypothetical protein